MDRSESRAELLKALRFRFGGLPPEGQIVVNTCNPDDTDFRTRAFRTQELERIAETFAVGDGETPQHVWARLSTVKDEVHLSSSTRGTEKDTYQTQLCHVDLDPDPDMDYADWRAVTLEALRQFDPPPSGIEDSGRGYYAFWKLLDPTKNWQRVKKINKWLALQLGGDYCFDVSHIFRLPGTLNPKPGVMRYSTVISYHPDRLYQLDAFGEADLTSKDLRVQESDLQPEVLPLDLESRLQATSKRLWQRIFTEESAQEAGASMKEDRSGVDRSRNDFTIATHCMRMGLTAGQVYAILTHPTWFSGSKFRQFRSDSYVVMTIERASAMVSSTEQTNPVLVGQRLLEEEDFMHYLTQWWRYDSERGVYESADRWITAATQDIAGMQWRRALSEEVMAYMLPHVSVNTADIPRQAELTNVKNGMLNWKTGELSAHSSRWKSILQVDAAWDPKADCRQVDAFVESILPEEAISTWWMFCGYCLYTDVPLPYRVILCVVGPKATGKSTLVNALIYFLGGSNVSHTSLAELTGAGNQFTTYQLAGRLLNADMDAPYDRPVRDVHTLKKLAAGDPIMIERKNKDATAVELPVKLLFTTNGFSVAENADEGYFDRWKVIKVRDDHRFDITNPNRKVLAHVALMGSARNRSAWLKRSVEGLQALTAAGGFPKTKYFEESEKEMRMHADTVYRFWIEETTDDTGATKTKTPLMTFYGHYKSWCNINGQTPKSMRGFSDHSRQMITEAFPGTEIIRTSERWNISGRKMKPRGVIVNGQRVVD
jgi:P4 family phage/plasmid primase-like protien